MSNWKVFKSSIPDLIALKKIGMEFTLIPIVILVFLAVSLLVLKRKQKLRWITQIISLLLFGFIFMHCLCLTKSIIWGVKDLFHSKFLSGLANLWFPLITFSFVLFLGRYFYCYCLCPIGFLQEITGRVNLQRKKITSLVFLLILLGIIGMVGWLYHPSPVILGAGAWLGFLLIITSIIILFYPKGERIFCKFKYLALIGWAILAVTAYKVPGPWCVVGQANLKYSAIISFLAILLVSAVFLRAWCQYICPDGALLRLLKRRIELRKQ